MFLFILFYACSNGNYSYKVKTRIDAVKYYIFSITSMGQHLQLAPIISLLSVHCFTTGSRLVKNN